MDGRNVGVRIMVIILRLVLVSLLLVFVIKGAQTAYSYGYRVFAQEPMTDEENARTVTITVSATDSVKDVAKRLKDRGLIDDAMLFRLQERISDLHGKMNPGTYELSTAMTPEEMLQRMAADDPTDADSPPAAEASLSENAADAETQEADDWEGEEGAMGEAGEEAPAAGDGEENTNDEGE